MFMKHYAPNRCLYTKVAKLMQLITGVGHLQYCSVKNIQRALQVFYQKKKNWCVLKKMFLRRDLNPQPSVRKPALLTTKLNTIIPHAKFLSQNIQIYKSFKPLAIILSEICRYHIFFVEFQKRAITQKNIF